MGQIEEIKDRLAKLENAVFGKRDASTTKVPEKESTTKKGKAK